jgi:site-specific recombinase XerD
MTHRPLALQSLSPTAHPMSAALARSGPGSQRTLLGAANCAARLLSGRKADAWSLPWREVRYENVLALRQAMVDLRYAPNTINLTLATVRSVLREAWRAGQLPGDVLQRVSDVRGVRVRQSVLAGRMLETHELGALLRSASHDGLTGTRDLALLALLYGLGLRRSEVIGMQLDDLRPDGLRVVGKGGREDLLPLTRAVRRLLAPWLRARGDAPGPLLYAVYRGQVVPRPLSAAGVYGILCRRGAAAGITHFSPHDLRRSFVSHLLDRGVELRHVQTLARHAQVATTQRYDRRPLRELGAAVARLHL